MSFAGTVIRSRRLRMKYLSTKENVVLTVKMEANERERENTGSKDRKTYLKKKL